MALAARDNASQKPVVASVSLSECNNYSEILFEYLEHYHDIL